MADWTLFDKMLRAQVTDTTTDHNVSTEGLTDAEVLVALYNGSHAQGMGVFSAISEPMTFDHANQLLAFGTSPDYGEAGQALKPRNGAYFDYLYGRVMKITLNGSGTVNTALYDRDLGDGHGRRVIEQALREKNGRERLAELAVAPADGEVAS
jgi:hypothetical protein